jgi:hypothetical protein
VGAWLHFRRVAQHAEGERERPPAAHGVVPGEVVLPAERGYGDDLLGPGRKTRREQQRRRRGGERDKYVHIDLLLTDYTTTDDTQLVDFQLILHPQLNTLTIDCSTRHRDSYLDPPPPHTPTQMDQLNVIFDVIGTPSADECASVGNTAEYVVRIVKYSV